MKLEEQRLLDEALVAEEPCLGAAFCSYTFDPAYFEEHVLRSLLRLRSDPDQAEGQYHEEARQALQETPVACIVDASVRTPGRRLPYDLHLVRRRTFHPKVMLALFDGHARVAIGSGNLTKSGLEQNTELFFVRRLQYADAADAAFLRDVSSFLAQCASLSEQPGTQLELVRGALSRRLEGTAALRPNDRVDVRFVSTFGGRLLDQLRAELPEAAKITRVGVLAPFFEQDDLDVAREGGLDTTLGELAALRPAPDAVFDIGAPWDDAPIAAGASAGTQIEAGLGRLWAWRRKLVVDGETVEQVEYLRLEAVTQRRVSATNSLGQSCRFDKAELETAIQEGRLWPVETPTVHAPKAILERLAQERRVQLWLHPTTTISSGGRPRRRPLHAKVFLVTSVHRNRTTTVALIGSANASRSALSRSVEDGGNVEAGVVCRFDGDVTLADVLPALVSYPIESVRLTERDSLEADTDISAWIEDVVHDAAASTLEVRWRPDGPLPFGDWTLGYLDSELARGSGAQAEPLRISPFTLNPKSAEVVLGSAGREWALPIRVLDLSVLPTSPALADLGLRELLAILGRRVGAERLGALRGERGAAAVDHVLDAIFGEAFGPTDVFKAWWGIVDDLESAATLGGFRQRLLGPMGARAAWQQLREAPDTLLAPDEAWVHGCELLRELRSVEITPGADAAAKASLLQEFAAELEQDLIGRTPAAGGAKWLKSVTKFYRIGGSVG